MGLRTIDIVVQDEERRRLAIQCDGDCAKTEEDLILEMEYYMTLRRLNWDIFQIRSTEYFTNPEKTFKRLLQRLKEAGISLTRQKPSEPEAASTDLCEMVTKKANNIRTRWNEPLKPLAEMIEN